MKTYTWETAKGAKVELTVSQSRVVKLNSDGADYGFEKTETCPMIEKFTVNGKEITVDNAYSFYKEVIFRMDGRKCECLIPTQIVEDIQAPVNKKMLKQLEAVGKQEETKETLRRIELESGEETALRSLEK